MSPLRLSLLPVLALSLYQSASQRALATTPGDSTQGQQAYQQRCASCHSLEFNGVGPAHRGLMGRKAGTVPDFAYSPALKSSAITWSEESLEKWLTDPEKFVPGQKMWIAVPDPVERQNIIAYLKSASRK